MSTLRAWERRFGLLEPLRSPGSQRLYTDTDVDRVLAVKRLVVEGLTLSAAVDRVRSAGAAALPAGEGEGLLFSQMFRVLNQGVCVAKDGRVRYANRQLADLLGCTVDEVLTRSTYDFIEPQFLAVTKERAQLSRLGARQAFEVELHRPDGSTFWAEVSSSPLQDRAGRYEGAVAIVTDITARKKAEQEARFRAALLDAVGEAVIAATPDATINYMNPAAVELFGWTAEEAVGESGYQFPAGKELGSRVAEMHERLLAGRTFSAELPLVRRDGTGFVGHLTATPVSGEEGDLVGFIGVIRDVTERVQLMEELRTREARETTVAMLGARALAKGRDIAGVENAVLQEIVEATRRLLAAERAAILDAPPDGELPVLAATQSGGPTNSPSGSRSLAGYTVLARSVVIVEDVRRERRFDPGSLAEDSRSAIAAPVFGPLGVRAVLMAESSTPRTFDQAAVDFLQALANVVGAALS